VLYKFAGRFKDLLEVPKVCWTLQGFAERSKGLLGAIKVC
jgi:hypothetical protein